MFYTNLRFFLDCSEIEKGVLHGQKLCPFLAYSIRRYSKACGVCETQNSWISASSHCRWGRTIEKAADYRIRETSFHDRHSFATFSFCYTFSAIEKINSLKERILLEANRTECYTTICFLSLLHLFSRKNWKSWADLQIRSYSHAILAMKLFHMGDAERRLTYKTFFSSLTWCCSMALFALWRFIWWSPDFFSKA